MALGPKRNKQTLIWGLKMVKDNIPQLQLVNKGPVMTLIGVQVGHSCPLWVFQTPTSMILGVCRKTGASSQRMLLTSPKSPEHGYLVDFMLLELLELSLEAQVGVGTGSPCTHSVQGILPAKVGDSHDVCDHQSHTPGDTGQAARAKRTHRGKGF